jgi:aminoglycoside phosphotransferase (APT) family kinase protein
MFIMTAAEVSKRLAEYYHQMYRDGSGLTVSGVEEISQGWETELYSFTVEYDGGNRRIMEDRVIRIYPGRGAARKAEKEYTVMSRLREAGYPVPEVFHIDVEGEALGRPFIIMERIVGRSMMEDFVLGSKEGLEGALALMIGLLVKLHRIEVKWVFPETNIGSTAEYIDSRLDWARWRRTASSGSILLSNGSRNGKRASPRRGSRSSTGTSTP